MDNIELDRDPQVICQCQPPCLLPFRDEAGELSPAGCLRPKGHEPPCSLDGTGDFTMRAAPERVGPQMRMRRDEHGVWRATCHRCGVEYALYPEVVTGHMAALAVN